MGELVLHAKWKKNKVKTDENSWGRLIYAVEHPHTLGPTITTIIECTMPTTGAERKIGHVKKGLLERDAPRHRAESGRKQ
eukprot:6495524-Pyramimonas_sp.AAC.1